MQRAPLDADTCDPDPIAQFRAWYADALRAGADEADAAALATAGADGQPSLRMVLVRGFDTDGFLFFTNYRSRKGRELAANPRAAILFHWSSLDRQVRIEGAVKQASSEESDAYFGQRPVGSRISAVVSPQSEVVASREVLEQLHRDLLERSRHAPPQRPAHWGGYRVVPDRIEFWQSGAHRLHDRIEYLRTTDGRWQRRRLAP